MLKLSVLLALFFSVISYGGAQLVSPASKKVDSSSSNVPVAYDQTAGSKFMTSLSGKYSHARVANVSATRISFVTSNDCGSSPSATSAQRLYVEAGEIRSIDDILILDCLFVQSEGSAISSGIVTTEVW